MGAFGTSLAGNERRLVGISQFHPAPPDLLLEAESSTPPDVTTPSHKQPPPINGNGKRRTARGPRSLGLTFVRSTVRARLFRPSTSHRDSKRGRAGPLDHLRQKRKRRRSTGVATARVLIRAVCVGELSRATLSEKSARVTQGLAALCNHPRQHSPSALVPLGPGAIISRLDRA